MVHTALLPLLLASPPSAEVDFVAASYVDGRVVLTTAIPRGHVAALFHDSGRTPIDTAEVRAATAPWDRDVKVRSYGLGASERPPSARSFAVVAVAPSDARLATVEYVSRSQSMEATSPSCVKAPAGFVTTRVEGRVIPTAWASGQVFAVRRAVPSDMRPSVRALSNGATIASLHVIHVVGHRCDEIASRHFESDGMAARTKKGGYVDADLTPIGEPIGFVRMGGRDVYALLHADGYEDYGYTLIGLSKSVRRKLRRLHLHGL